MLCIFHGETDPAFNLAAEEYLLKRCQEDIFMLWRNANAVIVGKHQNTLSEINTPYVREKGIRVVRRMSGGGAVFHDLGNLNFTFIMEGHEGHLVDFRKYTAPILEVLQQLGVAARFEGRNDLTIDGMKFSGNAEHVWKNRVLHHGTLLFSSELSDLAGALQSKPEKFHDKGVKSVRSRVTNISSHLPEPMDVLAFGERIMDHIRKTYADAVSYSYTAADLEQIGKLRREKYDTWEWNYGYSPEYNYVQSMRTAGGTVELRMVVTRGVIAELQFYGDFFSLRDPDELKQMFAGCRHDSGSIGRVLDSFSVEEYFAGVSRDELEGLFF